VPNTEYGHHPLLVVNRVEDAIIAYPETVTRTAREFHRVRGTGFFGEIFYRVIDALIRISRKLS